MVAFKPCWQKI